MSPDSFFNSKARVLVTGLTLVSFVVSTFTLKAGLEKANHFGVLQAGLLTCHKRLHQTLTSRLLNDFKNNALSESFLNTTESCFAEALKQMEALKDMNLKKALSALNNVSADVHWFNIHVNPKNNFDSVKEPEKLIKSNLNNRYKKIEKAKANISLFLDRAEESNQNSILYNKIAFFVLLAFSLAVIAIDVVGRRWHKRQKEAVEKRAGNELSPEHIPTRENIEVILKDALLVNAMSNSAILFTKYKVSMSLAPALAEANHSLIAKEDAREDTRKNIREDEIDKIWERSESSDTQILSYDETQYMKTRETTQLDAMLAKVVQSYANKLFVGGIALNFKVDENQYVVGDDETVYQILFSSLSYMINQLTCVKKQMGLDINLHTKNKKTILEYQYTNEAFKNHELKGASAHKNSIELSIVDELLTLLGGELIVTNQDGDIQNIKMIFNNAKTIDVDAKKDGAKLISLMRGRKSDLKRELLNNAM